MFRPGVISVIFMIGVGIDAEQLQNGVTGEPDHYRSDQPKLWQNNTFLLFMLYNLFH